MYFITKNGKIVLSFLTNILYTVISIRQSKFRNNPPEIILIK